MNEVIVQFLKISSSGIVGFLLALLFIPIWRSFLIKYKMGKQIRTEGAPIFQKLHQKKEGTPTMAGVVIWFPLLFLALIFFLLSKAFDGFWDIFNFLSRRETYLPLGALVLTGLLGALDDYLGILRLGPKGGGIGMREKIILYLFIASLLGWWFIVKLGITSIYFPFLGAIRLKIWYFFFFVFVVVATTFSANETDGLDGLLGGIAISALIPLVIISFLNNNYNLATFGAILLGTLSAFLWFNVYPAKFFMGDTGSMTLGIIISLLAILNGVILLIPFFMFIPMLESCSVLIQLFSKKILKKKIFLSTPFHHHFEALGLPEPTIVFRFWIVNALASLTGLIIYLLDKLI